MDPLELRGLTVRTDPPPGAVPVCGPYRPGTEDWMLFRAINDARASTLPWCLVRERAALRLGGFVGVALYRCRGAELPGPSPAPREAAPAGKPPASKGTGPARPPTLQTAAGDLLAMVETACSTPGAPDHGEVVGRILTGLAGLDVFLGVSPVAAEVVANLRTVAFQFRGKPVPPLVLFGLRDALARVARARRVDVALADRVADLLAAGGVDLHAVDGLRKEDGGAGVEG